MEEQSKVIEISLKDFWSVFKQCWMVVAIAFVVVVVGLYIGLTITHDDEYTASTKVYIINLKTSTEEGATSGNMNTSDISIANALIDDFKEIVLTGDNVLKPVMRDMGLEEENWKRLSDMVKVSTHDDSRILTISVTHDDPETARELAQRITERACNYVNKELYDFNLANLLEAAETPQNPSNPVSVLTVALVAFVVAAAVYAAYLVAFMLDDKINTAEDVEKYLGVSMLGMIPNRHDVSRRKSKYGYYYSHRAPDGTSEKK